MTPEVAEKARVGETSCSESLHQAHLKSWFIGLDSTQSSSEANLREIERKMQSSCDMPLPSTSVPSNCQLSHIVEGEQADQVTKDLCDNFKSWADSPVRRGTAEHPWKKTRMTPSGHILGTRQGAAEVPIATIPVSRHGDSPEGSSHDWKTPNYLDLKVGDVDGLYCEGYNRWGVKRKAESAVSELTHTYSEHCDRRLRDKLNDLYLRRVLANNNEGNLVAFNFMKSQRGQWASPSPLAYPAPPKTGDLYGPQGCSARGVGLKRPVPCRNGVNLDPKLFKAHQSRSSTNMLKLPKDMQGRWSSERYKSAQLKLIDIMHERRAQPGRPILRPALREEARKHIGDTGLLDHLLKHMTDTVVSTGERFRRRHNAEGAMEYWLEDASLMEIRKAAGIEDPSWLPPQGWKPGDKVQGGIWGINRSMSSSEAAEMNLLKDTVEILKREMKYLFERLKELKQMGVPLTVDMNDADGVKQRQTAHEIPQRPACDELKKKILQEHQEEQITTASSTSLEWQLAAVRKEVSRMQSDVQCILKVLCYKQRVRTSSGGSPQAEGKFGSDLPSSLVSSGEEVLSATNISETLSPAITSRGVLNAHPKPLVRGFASVNSATSSSTDAAGPITKETICVTKSPECQAKMGGSSEPLACPCPQEAVSAVWLNLTTISSSHGPPAKNSRWDDYINPFLRDQPGISTSTTNSPECFPGMQFNFPGVARTLAKDNCPVAAAMAGMFGCMMQMKQHPIKGENLEHIGTAFLHPELRHSTSDGLMAVSNTAAFTSKKPEKCVFGQDKTIMPSRFDRALRTRQATVLNPSDPSCSGHLDPPLSLSLALTLGSPV